MNVKKVQKITKYVISSAMLANAVAGQAAVFAANEKVEPPLAQAAVKNLFEKGIMFGDENGNFNLEGNLTRIQVAAILARSLNLDISKTPKVNFTDVSSDSWGVKYIDALANLGVIEGSDGQFRPNDVLTREELAVILVRITQTNIVGKGNNLPITDANQVSDWAKAYVQAAIEAGLIPVENGKFAPNKKVSRQEVASVTDNFIKNDKFEQYKKSANTLLDTGKKISNSDPTV
jgi:hypothetical protein